MKSNTEDITIKQAEKFLKWYGYRWTGVTAIRVHAKKKSYNKFILQGVTHDALTKVDAHLARLGLKPDSEHEEVEEVTVTHEEVQVAEEVLEAEPIEEVDFVADFVPFEEEEEEEDFVPEEPGLDFLKVKLGES